MSRDVERVEGKKEAVPITVFVQRKKNTKNTKTLLGGGGAINCSRIFAFGVEFWIPNPREKRGMSVLSSDRWTTLCVVFLRHNNIQYCIIRQSPTFQASQEKYYVCIKEGTL